MTVPFPPQPPGLPWPNDDWPEGPLDPEVDAARLDRALCRLFDQPPELGLTMAVVCVHHGRVVAERYEPPTDAGTPLISWSMAKSILHGVFGMLRGDGLLEPGAPAPVGAWADDERARITIQDLLTMRSGLRWNEDYVDAEVSHVIEMLFGEGAQDHAAYAAARPADAPPGEVWCYSSGTSNILARVAGDVVGGGEDGMRAFLQQRVFGPLGMLSADPGFDPAGTWVGSSYVHATARDFARFGYLYLRDGVWDGTRLLPEGWAGHARTFTAHDLEGGMDYGAHWWRWPDQPGSLAAHGYEGQYTIVLPARDLVVVRLGKTVAELRPNLLDVLREVIRAFPERAQA